MRKKRKRIPRNIMETHEAYLEALIESVPNLTMMELEEEMDKTEKTASYADYYKVYKSEYDKRKKKINGKG